MLSQRCKQAVKGQGVFQYAARKADTGPLNPVARIKEYLIADTLTQYITYHSALAL